MNRPKCISAIASVLVVAGALALESSEAHAQSDEETRTPNQPVQRRFRTNFDRRHDRGGFARMELGLGWVDRTVAAGARRNSRMSGVGFFPSVVGGVMPWPRIATHAGVWGMVGRGLVTIGAGPGATYYFNESGNLWIGAQLGPVTSSRDGSLLEEWALGGELGIGLFGWTGDRWSMGGSLFAGGDAIDLDDNGREIRSWRVGLRFGVAYN